MKKKKKTTVQEGLYSASICSVFLMKSLPSTSNCLMWRHGEQKTPSNSIDLIPPLLPIFRDIVVALMLVKLDVFH